MTTPNVAGNYYDKYHTKNPIARWLINGFLRAFDDLAVQSGAKAAYEAGCGEGHLSIRLAKSGFDVAGCDVDSGIVERAVENARIARAKVLFNVASLYDLDAKVVANRDLVVCCEVLEHVDDPQKALDVISKLTSRYVLISVPREPIWRALNVASGKIFKILWEYSRAYPALEHKSVSRFPAA